MGGVVGLPVASVGQIRMSSIPASTMSPLEPPSDTLTRSLNSAEGCTVAVALVQLALVETSPIVFSDVQAPPSVWDSSTK